MKGKKVNSRWSRESTRYSESRMVEDFKQGDAVAETAFIARTKEQPGWRKGAKVK